MSKSKFLKLSWIPYVLILFEMLYMATPFAVFFYSIYEIPLKFLNSSPYTAWMLQTVFPHFVGTNSFFINFLLRAGWFFMGLGFIIFFIAFVLIYYAKFTKKGAVTNGLYRIIRHPQYTAWTLFGLGISIVWSRIIVWMMFVTMIYIYYLLAKAEEEECLNKFPETYSNYLKQTGMFFPRIFKSSILKSSSLKPEINTNLKRFITNLLVMVMTVVLAYGLRNYTLSHIASVSTANYTAVSVTYMESSQVQKISEWVFNNVDVQKELDSFFSEEDKMILYILPQNWSIEELGMKNTRDHHAGQTGSSMRPSAHGNPQDDTPMKKRVIIFLTKLIGGTERKNILHSIKQQVPKLYVDINLETKTITQINNSLSEGIYGDIPVPLY